MPDDPKEEDGDEEALQRATYTLPADRCWQTVLLVGPPRDFVERDMLEVACLKDHGHGDPHGGVYESCAGNRVSISWGNVPT